jgi:hypothetical protein
MSEPIAAVQGASPERAVSAYRKYQQFVAESTAAGTAAPAGAAGSANADVMQRATAKAASTVMALIDQLKQALSDPTASAAASPASAPPISAPGDYFKGGAPNAKDAWGDSTNVNKTAVFQSVYDGVKTNWDSGAIPQNVKDLFSGAQTDPYYRGLDLASDPKERAQQKAAIWELAVASHETGGTYDPSKLPSYWEAGGSGTHAGQTQFAGMAPDPKGMTYGMFSTESSRPIDVSDPRHAVVADLQKFGADLAGFDGDLQKTLELIGQTDSTSVIPSIQVHGAEYLDAFSGG